MVLQTSLNSFGKMTSNLFTFSFLFYLGLMCEIFAQPYLRSPLPRLQRVPVTNLIINGFRSGPRPFFARVTSRETDEENKRLWVCSATIIHSYWVLSVAHCLRKFKGKKIYNESNFRSITSKSMIKVTSDEAHSEQLFSLRF